MSGTKRFPERTKESSYCREAFEGATLSLRSKTTLSLYFKSEKELSFACEGQTVEKETKNEYQIARIRDIPAGGLQNSYLLSVTAAEETGSVTYSPITYCYKVLSDSIQGENLLNVAKALFLYAEAADRYFMYH